APHWCGSEAGARRYSEADAAEVASRARSVAGAAPRLADQAGTKERLEPAPDPCVFGADLDLRHRQHPVLAGREVTQGGVERPPGRRDGTHRQPVRLLEEWAPPR